MFSKLSILEESNVFIGENDENLKVFNNHSYNTLCEKRNILEKKYKSFLREKPNDLLSYNIFNPIKIKKDKNNLFKIDKIKLNDIFVQSEEKRSHNEIYKSKLYELLNPYYLAFEKKYINEKYLSDVIKSKINKEREEIRDREYNISLNKLYDKKNNIYFALLKKNNNYNKIDNDTLLNNAVNNKDILVRLKNEDDGFEKNILLHNDFTMKDLKFLIAFIYRSVFAVNDPGEIKLFYLNANYEDIYIVNEQKTLLELSKEMKNKYELEIFITAEY